MESQGKESYALIKVKELNRENVIEDKAVIPYNNDLRIMQEVSEERIQARRRSPGKH